MYFTALTIISLQSTPTRCFLVYGWIMQASFTGHVGRARKWPENEATAMDLQPRSQAMWKELGSGLMLTEVRKLLHCILSSIDHSLLQHSKWQCIIWISVHNPFGYMSYCIRSIVLPVIFLSPKCSYVTRPGIGLNAFCAMGDFCITLGGGGIDSQTLQHML